MTYLCIKNRSELDHLEKYKNVDDLKIKCNLTEIPDLKDFEDLTELDLSDNKIKSLVGFKNLKGLKNLKKLFLTKSSIEYFNGLKYLKNLHNLKILSLTSNKIKSFTMLKELSNLKSFISNPGKCRSLWRKWRISHFCFRWTFVLSSFKI